MLKRILAFTAALTVLLSTMPFGGVIEAAASTIGHEDSFTVTLMQSSISVGADHTVRMVTSDLSADMEAMTDEYGTAAFGDIADEESSVYIEDRSDIYIIADNKYAWLIDAEDGTGHYDAEISQQTSGGKTQEISFESEEETLPFGHGSYRNELSTSEESGNGIILYSSNNEDVATVDGNGNVSIVAVGEATISARKLACREFDNATAQYTLTIIRGESGVYFPQTDIVKDQNAENFINGVAFVPGAVGTLAYSSEDQSVATVDEDTGEITIVGLGETVINAEFTADESSDYESSTASYNLVVLEIAGSVSFENTEAECTYGDDSGNFNTINLPNDCDDPVVYSSKMPDVATVDSNTGVCTIVGTGSALIIATVQGGSVYNGQSAYYFLHVGKKSLSISDIAFEKLYGQKDPTSEQIMGVIATKASEALAGSVIAEAETYILDKINSGVTYSISGTASGTDGEYRRENAVIKFLFAGDDNFDLTIADGALTVNSASALEEESYKVDYKILSGGVEVSGVHIDSSGDDDIKWATAVDIVPADTSLYLIKKTDNGSWGDSIRYDQPQELTGNEFLLREIVSGIISGTQIEAFAIDGQAPKIVGVELKEKYDETVYRILNVLTFNAFFDEELELTIQAVDKEIDGATYPSSGLRSISLLENNVPHADGAKTPDDDGKVSYIIANDFSGEICAVATDNVGNDSDEFTYGIVVETQEMHNEKEHIIFEYEDNDGKTDIDGNKLYKTDAVVKVTVKDDVSGITEVSCEDINKGYSGIEDETIDLTGTQTVGAVLENGWKIVSVDDDLCDTVPESSTEGAEGYVTEIQRSFSFDNEALGISFNIAMTDGSGNSSEADTTVSTDMTVPTMDCEIIKDDDIEFYLKTVGDDEQKWYNNGVSAKISAKDDGSGLMSLKTLLNDVQNEFSEYTEYTTESEQTIGASDLVDGKNVFTARAEDRAGNTYDLEETVYIDTTSPEISGITVDKLEMDYSGEVRFFEFGTFFNDYVEIVVHANDEVGEKASVGLKNITLYIGETAVGTKAVDDSGSAAFSVPSRIFLDDDGTVYANDIISAIAEDLVGNVSASREKPSDIENFSTPLLSDRLLIETVSPEIEMTYAQVGENGAGDGYYLAADGKRWYNGNTAIDFAVSDGADGSADSSGLFSIEYKLNGAAPTTFADGSDNPKSCNSGNKAVMNSSVTVNTEPNLRDGRNEVVLTAQDNAGNKTSATAEVYIDTAAPEITGFTIEKKESAASAVLRFLSFGVFSNEKLNVTVRANDLIRYESDSGLKYRASVGVKSVTLYIGDDEFATLPVSDQNTAVFTIPAELVEDSINIDDFISATATDRVSNVSSEKSPSDIEGNNISSDRIMIETIAPTAEAVYPQPASGYCLIEGKDGEPDKHWYDKCVDITFNVSDVESGLNAIAAEVNNTDPTQFNPNISVSRSYSNLSEKKYNDTLVVPMSINPVEGKNVIKQTSEDNAGNVSEVTAEAYLDTLPPVIADFDIVAEGDATGMTILNFLSFGTFFNSFVEVTVRADDGNGVGVAEITLYTTVGETVTSQTKKVESGDSAVFKLPKDEVKSDAVSIEALLSATAVDLVGNAAKEKTTPTSCADEGAILNDTIMIETIRPGLSVAYKSPAYRDNANNKDWYSEDVLFDITASDWNAGIRSLTARMNGKNLDSGVSGSELGTFYDTQNRTTKGRIGSYNAALNTSQVDIAADGSYKLELETVDNASNSETDVIKVYKDDTSPEVLSFSYAPLTFNEGDGLKSTLQKYAYYGKEQTRVTVTYTDTIVNDGDSKVTKPSSGIASVVYHLEATNGTLTRDIYLSNFTETSASFNVPADFKGYIYVRVTDNVGHTSDFVRSNGVILEKSETHETEEHISLAIAPAAAVDANGVALYKDDVKIAITLTDTYSGLRSVEWSIVAPFDDKAQVGTVTVSNDGDVLDEGASDCLTGWNATAQGNTNLIEKLSTVMTVSNNSNSIVVAVKITDRAGNTTEKSIVFGIDAVVPTINITYDNNTPDEETGIFNDSRIATVEITERNFNSDKAVISITNTDGKLPEISEWSTLTDQTNPDQTIHKVTIKYTADGDYTFTVSFTDDAGNAASSVAEHKFTIDKTLPVVAVSYDNNNVSQGKFFMARRTATITVTEHNFAPARVKITKSAQINGEAVDAPEVSAWTVSGDVRTATISYVADGSYTFDIAASDMAGNDVGEVDYGTSAVPNEFIIDSTLTKPTISGVQTGISYKEDISMSIAFSDDYLDSYDVSLLRTKLNEKDKDVTAQFVKDKNISVNEKTGKILIDSIEKIPENDAIYSLSATVSDKAGNTSKETVKFAVNRFGSVYVYSDGVSEVIKRRNLKAIGSDFGIIEYNPNKLVADSINVSITRDGKPLEKVNYSITPTPGQETKEGNSGWYEYRYIISKANFKEDGIYKLSISSEDEAGNVPENTNDNAEITFRIDNMKPEITSILGLESRVINAAEQEVTVSVFDSIGLAGIEVFLNDSKNPAVTVNEFDDITKAQCVFKIKEGIDQKVRIVVTDIAGNDTDTQANDFLPAFEFNDTITVSQNLFIRWRANKPVFYGSIGAAAAIVIALGGIAVKMTLGKRSKATAATAASAGATASGGDDTAANEPPTDSGTPENGGQGTD